MAIDKDQEEKEVEDDDNKPNETILEKKEQRDPDEAVFAEQAIHHYAQQALDNFRDQAEMAMSSVESFISSQLDQEMFNDRAFLDDFGAHFLKNAMSIFGNAHSPIAQAVFPMLDDAVDESAREGHAQTFVQDMSTALRDVSWYLTDNLQSVLSNQWDELRDLAYEGATDFIPMLHALGLPELNFDGNSLAHHMTNHAEHYMQAQPKKKEEEVQQADVANMEEEEKKMEEPEVQNMALEEEEKEELTM